MKAASGLERFLARFLQGGMGGVPASITLWDGYRVPRDQTCDFDIEIADHEALWLLMLDPDFQFGELYGAGRLKVSGGLTELLGSLSRGGRFEKGGPWRDLLNLWHRPHANSLTGSRRNIHQHYDLGNDFYRLWLDQDLVYTCAYFRNPDVTLEQAQTDKFDHVCRKLDLQPGWKVVEAGCGWGALAIHMAKHYGVTVKAYNISRQQMEWARQRAQKEGLVDRVEFVTGDYRSIDGQFDAFVSVGMLEHVGLSHYRELGTVIDRVLAPDGRALLHTIGQNRHHRLNAWIESRIFPGAQPPTLRQMMDILEPFNFSVLDVENLRLHYARTLEHWLERFERVAQGPVHHQFGPDFVRIWRLYLSGSIASFASGGQQLFQVLFNRGASNHAPLTRDSWYQHGNL